MQIAKISVLHKKGDKNDLNNYRPVSILPVFSKGLEKLIHSRLAKYFEKYNMITQSQFGFQKNKSTELALLEEKEFILRNLENRKLVLGIFIDFTKAFDYLNHELLLKKLQYYGIRGQPLRLFQSYLGYRKQYVCCNNFNSTINKISSGVPQGSILGPFLFNIYVNDIVNSDPSSKFIIYADDTTILLADDRADELVSRANILLDKITTWTKRNALKINTNKTKAMLFRPKNKTVSSIGSLFLNSERIDLVESFKTLGVVFSNNMSWDSHIEYISKKLSQVVGLLHRNRYILPTSVKILLYKSLFFSQLNYCHLVWGTTTATNLCKIHMLQKRIVRIIANVPFNSHTESLFRMYNIVLIHKMYNYRLAVKFRNELLTANTYLTQLSHLREHTLHYRFRNPERWSVPTCRLNIGKEMLSFRLPKLLNIFCSNNIFPENLSMNEIRSLMYDFCYD